MHLRWGGDNSSDDVNYDDYDDINVVVRNGYITFNWSVIKFKVTDELLKISNVISGIRNTAFKNNRGAFYALFKNDSLSAITDYSWNGYEKEEYKFNNNVKIDEGDEIVIMASPHLEKRSVYDYMPELSFSDMDFDSIKGLSFEEVINYVSPYSESFTFNSVISNEYVTDNNVFIGGENCGAICATVDNIKKTTLFNWYNNKQVDAETGVQIGADFSVALLFKDVYSKNYSTLMLSDEDKAILRKLIKSAKESLAETATIDRVEDAAVRE